MRSLVTLLFVSMTYLHIGAQESQEINFAVELLEADLNAIEIYHDHSKIDFDAHVYWPVDYSDQVIAFRIRRERIGKEIYLNICGSFEIMTSPLTGIYKDGLFFKNDKFYVTNEEHSSVKHVSRGTTVRHTAITEPSIMRGEGAGRTKQRPLLSIRYFSLNEIERFVRSFHDENENYLKSATDESPATFLAMAPSFMNHVVEYSVQSKDQDAPDVFGNLRVLVGKKVDGIVSLFSSVEAPKLLFNQKYHSFSVLNSSGNLVKDVYGIRMSRIGFVGELVFPRIRLLSTDDLWFVSNPVQHVIFVKDFLSKVRDVEPKHPSRCGPTVDPRQRPKSAKLQMMGHILVKSINYVDDGEVVDENCPLIIDYETNLNRWIFQISQHTIFFKYGSLNVKRICTDDSRLWAWPESAEGTPSQMVEFDSKKVITLNYPDVDHPSFHLPTWWH